MASAAESDEHIASYDPLAPVVTHLAGLGVQIDAHSAPCWDGTPFSLALVIDTLLGHRPLVANPHTPAHSVRVSRIAWSMLPDAAEVPNAAHGASGEPRIGPRSSRMSAGFYATSDYLVHVPRGVARLGRPVHGRIRHASSYRTALFTSGRRSWWLGVAACCAAATLVTQSKLLGQSSTPPSHWVGTWMTSASWRADATPAASPELTSAPQRDDRPPAVIRVAPNQALTVGGDPRSGAPDEGPAGLRPRRPSPPDR